MPPIRTQPAYKLPFSLNPVTAKWPDIEHGFGWCWCGIATVGSKGREDSNEKVGGVRVVGTFSGSGSGTGTESELETRTEAGGWGSISSSAVANS